MHIPDGYLSPIVAGITLLLTLGFLLVAIRKISLVKETLNERISLFIALSAGIFVAQMIAWPIPGGTSLHLIGGALVGILVGPWLGILSMTLVLLVQCLVFHDGGLTAIGANILNMGIVGVLVGYAVFKTAYRATKKVWLGSFLAGWFSLILAGLACGIELGASWNSTLPIYVMTSWHAVLGLVEGLITSSVVSYLTMKSPKVVGWS
ncbi:MAG: energy-coupling factor ABC transporter permease [Desulfurococcaceae archaeon TW002]